MKITGVTIGSVRNDGGRYLKMAELAAKAFGQHTGLAAIVLRDVPLHAGLPFQFAKHWMWDCLKLPDDSYVVWFDADCIAIRNYAVQPLIEAHGADGIIGVDDQGQLDTPNPRIEALFMGRPVDTP